MSRRPHQNLVSLDQARRDRAAMLRRASQQYDAAAAAMWTQLYKQAHELHGPKIEPPQDELKPPQEKIS